MIRVCLVAPAYMTGGQAIEARTLLEGFAGDPDVRVELQPIDPKLPRWMARIRFVRTIVRMPLYWTGLIRRVLRSDVVHVFTAAFWPFLLTTTPAVLLGRLLGRPVILNYRDGRAADHIGYAWVRWVLRKATLLVFPSGFLHRLFAKFGFTGIIIHNVVNTERFRFRPRSPLRPILLSCRLLETLYAVENTIRAFVIVKQRQPVAQLFVVGDGHCRAELEEMVRSANVGGIEFVGAIPHESMAEWFDRADILVNSSRIDNMPHALIEAFAAGLPVVTTGVGGIPFIVESGRNGLIVPTDDPAAMAGAIIRLLEEPELVRRLVDEGQRDCAQHYAWKAAKGNWSRTYAAVLAGNASLARNEVAQW